MPCQLHPSAGLRALTLAKQLFRASNAGFESKPIQWKMPMDRRYAVSILLAFAFGASHPARTQEVQRVDVREGGLVGRFYAAVGASRRTGVLMLTGSGGSYPDDAAARDLGLAGFPVLAIAY